MDTTVNLDLNNATGFLPYMYYWQGQAKYQLQQYVEAITDFLGYLPETIKNFQIARQYGTEA